MDKNLILVTGASGYIGGRLIPLLLDHGCRVRCLVREPGQLRRRAWFPDVEIFPVDLVAGDALERALDGAAAAYYLVHSMASGRRYHERDLAAAANFARAAGEARVGQIIYLGGLADPVAHIGRHMRSRIETGEVLRRGSVPVTEFRAGVIVGPGSISFEMIRFLSEQLPLLVGPRWLENRVQPISVEDVLAYLVSAPELPASRGRIFEIGGRDVMTFAETMRIYARLRGLRRPVLTLPFLPIGLMAFGVDRLTPVPASIAAPLIDGMRSDSVVRDNAAREVFPDIHPSGYRDAVLEALDRLSPGRVEPLLENRPKRIKIIKHEGFLIDDRKVALKVAPEQVYRVFVQLGGKQGWLFSNGLWRLRGRVDRLLGGPGMRGRERPADLRPGDVVDFYRVEAVEPGRLLRLRAELKAPGEGWMEWRSTPFGPAGTLLSQTAFFAPKGVPGFLYWYLLYPIHAFVFAGLFERLARKARENCEPAGKRTTIFEKE